MARGFSGSVVKRKNVGSVRGSVVRRVISVGPGKAVLNRLFSEKDEGRTRHYAQMDLEIPTTHQSDAGPRERSYMKLFL